MGPARPKKVKKVGRPAGATEAAPAHRTLPDEVATDGLGSRSAALRELEGWRISVGLRNQTRTIGRRLASPHLTAPTEDSRFPIEISRAAPECPCSSLQHFLHPTTADQSTHSRDVLRRGSGCPGRQSPFYPEPYLVRCVQPLLLLSRALQLPAASAAGINRGPAVCRRDRVSKMADIAVQSVCVVRW